MRTFLSIAGAVLLGFAAAKSVGYATEFFESLPKRTTVGLPADAERVIVLTRDTCPYCKRLIAWLDANDVQYTSYDVMKSRAGMRLFSQLGESSVPVTIVDGYRIVGFKPD